MRRKLLKSLVLLSLSLFAACNVSRVNSGDDDDEILDAAVKEDFRRPPCLSLGCRVTFCKGGNRTVLTGIVNIPAGNLPLPNAYVYVPNSTLEPIPDGVNCNRCDAPLSGSPITKTRTDASGRFRLENVPDGPNVPLVVQLGKWRRQVTLAQVDACVDNVVDADLTRLPRNQDEGSIPRIALSTGSADGVECLLRKIGIADSEFTPEAGSGRVNLYTGEGGTPRYDAALNGGATFTSAPTFWSSLDNLKKYDVVLHSCEGTPTVANKSVAARQALLDYLSIGGRVFGSHYHYVWVEQGPAPMPSVATWNHRGDLGTITADIDTSFTAGADLADWLMNVGASTQRGKLALTQAKADVQTINPSLAQRWIHAPGNVQYLSFNAPLGAVETGQCGRMVFTDIHVANGDTSNSGLTFPSGGCRSAALSPQEKALVYMLFDLSNCLQPIPPPG